METIQIEKAFLAALLNNPEIYPEVRGYGLEVTELSPGLRAIYTAGVKLIEKGIAPEARLMELDLLQTEEYIQKSFDVDYRLESVSDYFDIIRQGTIYKAVNKLGLDISKLASENAELQDIQLAMLNGNDEVNRLRRGLRGSNTKFEKAKVGNLLNQLRANVEADRGKPESEIYLSTPYKEFNDRFGGLFFGDTTMIAGATGMGKTAFASCLSDHAIRQGVKVGHIILEMSEEQLLQRRISAISGLTMMEIRKRTFLSDPRKSNKYFQAVEEIEELSENWHIFGTENNQLEDIIDIIRGLADEGVKLVVIDFLQLLHYKAYAHNRALELGVIAQTIVQLGKELNMHLLVLVQPNRDNSSKQDKRLEATQIKGSSDIEQAADIVITVYRDSYYNHDSEMGNTAEISLVKNRNGETGMFYLDWNGVAITFTNPTNKYVSGYEYQERDEFDLF